MLSEFVERRLKQMAPIGAVLGTHAYGDGRNLVWVSTISLGGKLYTRAENHGRTIMKHYEGVLSNEEAARLFRIQMKQEQGLQTA